MLKRLRGGLIVSCEPVPCGPLDRPRITAAFALAALDGGARGLRIERLANFRAVRAITSAPFIGLIKEDQTGSLVPLTAKTAQVRDLAEAGADIIAFDATGCPRREPLSQIVAEIHRVGRLAMADCAEASDGRTAQELGAEVLGSTLPEGPEDRIEDGASCRWIAMKWLSVGRSRPRCARRRRSMVQGHGGCCGRSSFP